MKLWVKDVLERAVSTAAEATLALWAADQLSSALSVDWKLTAGVAGLAGLTAVLKSLAALKVNSPVSSASLVPATKE